MKLKDIITINTQINGIMGKKLPVRVAFIISRNVKKLSEIVSDYDEKRITIIKKYAETDDDGNIITDEHGNAKIIEIANANKDLTELVETEINIEFDKLTLEDLEKCDSDAYDSLTPIEISCLDFMID